MKNKISNIKHLSAFVLGTVLSITALAQPAGPAEPALTETQRQEILQTLSTKLKANYVFPDVASNISSAVLAKAGKGGYASVDTAGKMTEVLSRDLREFSNDKHFRVLFDPEFKEDEQPDAVPTKEEMDKQRIDVEHMSYGVEKVQHLPGNIGYIELRGFGPTELVGAAYSSAISLLAGTDAMIVDLRRNGGGKPTSVAYFMSHFFALGDERHLNDIYTRKTDSTQQSWTVPSVTVRYTKPVYVLISPRTFSGGEECAYDFQTQKRAVLVGETTGGGANPVDGFSLGHGMVVAIPVGRAVNPITHTNWEHTGVKPDVVAKPAEAQQVAYVAILRDLVAKTTDPEEKEYLQKTLSLAEKGESEPPRYTMGH